MTTVADRETVIPWSDDVDKALTESKKSGKPLLFDFSAAPM